MVDQAAAHNQALLWMLLETGISSSEASGEVPGNSEEPICQQPQTIDHAALCGTPVGDIPRDHADYRLGSWFCAAHITPLSSLQQQIVSLCGFSPAIYFRLADDS